MGFNLVNVINKYLKTATSNRDIYARTIDRIIEIIGMDNIKLFLPMWETTGTTATDLINKDLTFTINGGPTLGVAGGLGTCMQFTTATPMWLEQDPMQQSTDVTGAALPLDSPTKKLATKFTATKGGKVGIIRARVARPANLSGWTPYATLGIYSDNAGVPGVLLGASTRRPTESLPVAGATDCGFDLPTPVELKINTAYWIVMEYTYFQAQSIVDATHFPTWQSGVTNGEATAVYDGATWTVTPNTNLRFSLYTDALALEGDFSVVAMAVPDSAIFAANWSRKLWSFATFGRYQTPSVGSNADEGNMWKANFAVTNPTYLAGNPGDYQYLYSQRNLSGAESVITLTFSKARDAQKFRLYFNQNQAAAADGVAGYSHDPIIQPLCIGRGIDYTGAGSANWKGLLGPVIVTRNELTAVQVSQITQALLYARNFNG